jgi:hypothetical protein
MSIEKPLDLESPLAKIQDAGNQFVGFSFVKDFAQVKQLIGETKFKTLEEYTGRTTDELDAVRPGVCARYNKLVSDLQNPELTSEQLQAIMKEAVETVI